MGRIPSTVYALSVGLGTSYFVTGFMYLIAVINITNSDLTTVKCEGTVLEPPFTTLPTYFTTYPKQWPCKYLALEIICGIVAILIGMTQIAFNLTALGTNSSMTPWFIWLLVHAIIALLVLIVAIITAVILSTTATGLLSFLSPGIQASPQTILLQLPPMISLTKTRPKTLRALVQLFVMWGFINIIFCIVGSIFIIRCRKELLTEKPAKLEITLDKIFDGIGAFFRKKIFPKEAPMTADASTGVINKR